MKSAPCAKQKHDVPWTFVASAKSAKPRLVLTSHFDAGMKSARAKRVSQSPDISQLGSRLEHAFVRAVKAAKRKAAKKQ